MTLASLWHKRYQYFPQIPTKCYSGIAEKLLRIGTHLGNLVLSSSQFSGSHHLIALVICWVELTELNPFFLLPFRFAMF